MKQLKQPDNKIMIYPIYHHQSVLNDICDTLGYDINTIINKDFNHSTKVYTLGKYDFPYILFVGLGDVSELTTAKLRKLVLNISKNISEPVQLMTDHLDEGIDKHAFVRIWVESHIIAQYQECKIGHDAKMITDLDIVSSGYVEKDIETGRIYGEGINYARRLADTPSNLMTPEDMVKEAVELAKTYNIEYTILNKSALEEMKAGGILSVNQGSHIPAYMIVLKYTHNGNAPHKAVIGKGITFDSGGYNLKSNSYGMKYDMCGGADVLGIMKILAGIQAKTNVYGIIPVTENLVNGKAYKPQDVITTLSGKTVEVVSTDAEGRLILCDAITYAQRLGASHLIDLGTLTGPALGDVYTAVFANDDVYYQEFEEAMKAADEKGWRLPMDEEYLEKLQSNSADFKNGPMTFGGEASGAACLLNEFVEDGNKWIHLDIAATAKTPDGATGAMIRSIVELLKS
ncbi:M17 family metallopeptidase [Clostridium sp. AUH-JLR23]|uniref:leucyl aminopeptidase family protein n=1 Tax=Clostridium sp. AUH-JLR23 TaxID=1505062 RepID=UPI0035653867